MPSVWQITPLYWQAGTCDVDVSPYSSSSVLFGPGTRSVAAQVRRSALKSAVQPWNAGQLETPVHLVNPACKRVQGASHAASHLQPGPVASPDRQASQSAWSERRP